jgi:hypothetical protein
MSYEDELPGCEGGYVCRYRLMEMYKPKEKKLNRYSVYNIKYLEERTSELHRKEFNRQLLMDYFTGKIGLDD